jgi:hypothetical protein
MEMEDHLRGCPACRRYRRAVEAGIRLVRALPPLEISHDFRPRLNHRIYHLEDGASIARETLGSGATTVAVLAVAALLAVAAWTPTLRGMGPTQGQETPLALEPVPEPPVFTPPSEGSTFPRRLSPFTADNFQDGLWGDTHQLLFEFSSLSQRRRTTDLVRVGVE